MALDKQNISLSLGRGIDTKSDPKQVLPAKLLLLQNATFQETGALVKRNGYETVGNDIGNGNALAVFKDELIAMDGSSLSSYSEQQDQFINKGNKIACDLSVFSVIKNSYEQTDPDSAYGGGYSCHAWIDSSGGVRYSVFDTGTGQAIISNQLINADGSAPKVLSFNGFFVVIYLDTVATRIKAFTVSQSNPSTTASHDLSLYGTGIGFDAMVLSGSLWVVYNNSSNVLTVDQVNTSFAVANTYAQGSENGQVKCIFNNGTNIYVAYYDGTDAKFLIIDQSGVSVLSPTTIEASVTVKNITGIVQSGVTYFYYECESETGSNSDQFIRKNTYTSSVQTPSDFIRSVGLYSKPFSYNGSHYITVVHESTLQSVYFVLNEGASAIAKIAPNNGGDLITVGVLKEVNNTTENQYSFDYLIKDLVASVNGDAFTQTGVNAVMLNLGEPITSQAIGNNLQIAGSIATQYDGQNVVEKGFNLYPEDIEVETSLAGGNLSEGQYQYCEVFEWADAQGQIHQSAPSVPKTVNTAEQYMYIGVNTTNGSMQFSYTTLTDLYNLTYFTDSGYGISGTNIPPGARVTTSRDTDLSAISIAATGTGSVQAKFTPGKGYSFLSSLGSNQITIPDFWLQNYNYSSGIPKTAYKFVGNIVNGSTTVELAEEYDDIKVYDVLRLIDTSGTAHSRTILSKTGRTLTLNASIPVPSLENALITITGIFGNGSITNGSPTITGVTSFDGSGGSFGTAPFLVGESYWFLISGGPNVYTIKTLISKTSTTLTFDSNFTFNAASRNFQRINPVVIPYVGQILNDTGSGGNAFSGPVEVLAVNGRTITVSERAISSGMYHLYSPSGYANTLWLDTLRVTEKQNVSLALYRTLVNQNTFFRVTSFTSPVLNDKTVDSIEYVDTLPDSLLEGNEQLYTTGGVVINSAPPAADFMFDYKNRSVLIPSESDGFWYSKIVVPSVPAEFSDQFTFNMPERGGRLICGAQMDDKLILFKRGLIYLVLGDGPADTGANNDFTEPQLISSDCGCIDKKSLVSMPYGLMFKSAKGIYLLKRNLEVVYIGSDVEGYNQYTITSAKMIETLNQVRYTTSSGDTLVYDYLEQKWSVFTGISAVDSVIYDDKFTYIGSNGVVLQETPGVFTDSGNPILIRLKTAWLSLAGLQGFQRVRKMLILGEYKSPHTLEINVAYDFKNSYTQNVSIPVSTDPLVPYQYRVDFEIQKCEAIQIELSEQQSESFGEGLSLSALSFEVGIKKGLNKLPSSQSYG